MIEKMAWETFKNTGNINTMIELLKMDKEGNLYGITKNAEKIETNFSTTKEAKKNGANFNTTKEVEQIETNFNTIKETGKIENGNNKNKRNYFTTK